MIIIKLVGGLGNQMFQYAMGRCVAEKNNVQLKIDISEFETYLLHKYSLSNYNIIENYATKKEIQLIKNKYNLSGNKLIKRVFFKQLSYINEDHFHFNPKILKIKDNVYLDGYWQSEKYFTDIQTTIRKDFTVKKPQEGKNKIIAEEIRKSNSVSLHIRRGDYVSNSLTNSVHGICSLDYYYDAISLISNRFSNPHFYIFSDDVKWAYENLKSDCEMTFIDHNKADKNYEDLRLMSQCRHNIIANSSFSWWGAWLNENPNKIVIAPNKWFNGNSKNTDDLIPEKWIRI